MSPEPRRLIMSVPPVAHGAPDFGELQRLGLNADEVLDRFKDFNLQAVYNGHHHGFTEKTVRVALPLENAYPGAQRERYELRPEDLLFAEKEARKNGMDLIGIFHSHPDCDAYFSKTDLENSCPWYSFVVLSIQKGQLHHANSWLPNMEQTEAAKEELEHPNA